MKVKVINNFVDKNTKKLHKAGEKIEVTPERLKELNGFVTEIKKK